jgi:23S rRNA (guanosine2251-2'-O)-methyltransferase
VSHRVCGINTVVQLHAARPAAFERLYLQADLGAERRARLAPLLAAPPCPVATLPAEDLDRLAGGARHQGVVADVGGSGVLDEGEARRLVAAADAPLVLLLDGVQDPRNLGACLRTANAAGVDLVVTGRNRTVGLTPATSKVASGAAELQPLVQVANLVRFMEVLKAAGVWLVGLDAEAPETLYARDLRGPTGLVLGAEGEGLRRLTRERCDFLASLPMAPGAVGSLNVAVATGVALYECRRQRLAGRQGVG